MTPGNFTGRAFDQCNAPRQHAMDAWLHSPYRGVGIYISGALRACSRQKNLTPTWVRTQLAHGWKLLPIHVGRQASCTQVGRFRSYRISARPARGYAIARAQGRAEANSAARAARRLGLSSRSTIFYDLEGFRVSGPACRDSTLQFLSSWTKQLRAHGYTSGVYSGAASGIRLLDKARAAGTPVALPQQIWMAEWDGDANTVSSHIRAAGWPNGRVKQYRGDHRETHGGVRIQIDSNYVDLGSGNKVRPAPRKQVQAAPRKKVQPAARRHVLVTPRRHFETAPPQHFETTPPPQVPVTPRERVRATPRPSTPAVPRTPEQAKPVVDKPCTTARINQVTYPSTGRGKRAWLHPVLQCLLKQNGLYESHVDGWWGARTSYGAHKWQARAGHKVKSKINRSDWISLLVAGNKRPRLSKGAHGADVVRLQRALHAARLTDLHINGTFDHETALAVRSYQRRTGIPESGQVGRTTWRYLEAGRF